MEHAPRSELTALIVDDDPFIASTLAELLDDEGYDVHTASNGFSAMRRAVDERPAVILLDLALPERSGTELLEDLRADPVTRNLAIIVVTGNVDLLSEAQRAAADAVVSKPFDADELLDIIRRALQRVASRRGEVAPVAATSHREASVRSRRPASTRHARGRR